MSARLPIKNRLVKLLYSTKKLSSSQIAERFHCSSTTIVNRLKELNIKRCYNTGKRIKHHRKNFSGNKIERSYLVGFRLGDLNTYCTRNTIITRCHTTQLVQVNLMKKLFTKYGYLGISHGRNGFNINCYLNKTFSFLIPKTKCIPHWILKKKDYFCSFVAGYTDAEGNFILNDKRARFKIDSYDREILQQIHNTLTKLMIITKFRIIGKKGQLRKDRTSFNQDLWRLNINDAHSIHKFILLIKPFLKHEKRLEDLVTCQKNILARIENGTI